MTKQIISTSFGSKNSHYTTDIKHSTHFRYNCPFNYHSRYGNVITRNIMRYIRHHLIAKIYNMSRQ